MANKIQIKRGAFSSLPQLSKGEFGFSNDAGAERLHIGNEAEGANIEIAMLSDVVSGDLFDAYSIIATDATAGAPTSRTIAEQRIVGRLTGGNIGAVTIGVADNNMVQMEGTGGAIDNFSVFTTNGIKGITAETALGNMSAQSAANFDWNTSQLKDLVDPTDPQDAATKNYVDSIATGLIMKASCRLITTAALPSNTAAGSGVGKTLTMNAVGILTLDGSATVLGDRLLVNNEASGINNGIYEVTTEGTGGVAAILTRAEDFDEDGEVLAGSFTFVTEGTTHADEGWVLTTDDPITVDTTSLSFSKFSSINAGATRELDNLQNVAINVDLVSDSSDTDSLGSTTKEWRNLYIGDVGKVYLGLTQDTSINRSAADEMTLTASAGVKTSAAFSSGSTITAGTIDAGTSDYDKFLVSDAGEIKFRTGAEVISDLGIDTDYATRELDNLQNVAINTSLLPAGTTQALGSTSKQWADIFLASGGVINFGNGDVTITQNQQGELNFSDVDLTGIDTVGTDSDNYIGWDASSNLVLGINTVVHNIASISDGAADNDKLVTQGYVDDAIDTSAGAASWIGLTDTDPTGFGSSAGYLVTVNSGETGLEFTNTINGGTW